MKNINYKAISTGIILLLSSVALYFLILLLINTAFAFDHNRRPYWGENYQFVIDKNDQKFLLKISSDDKKMEVFDLEKKFLKTEDYNTEKESKEYVPWENYRFKNTKYKTRELSGFLKLGDRIDVNSREKWYFLTQKKYFIGYDIKTAMVLGYIGTNGFSAELKDIQPFHEFQSIDCPRDGLAIIVTDKKGYCIRIPKREIMIFEKENDEKIDCILPKFDKSSLHYSDADLIGFVLKSDKRIKSYSADGKLLRSLVLPKETLKNSFFSIVYTDRLYVKTFEGDFKTGYFYVVKEISPNGEVIWEYTMDKMGDMDRFTFIDYNLFAIPFMGRLAMNILNRYHNADIFEPNFNILKNPEFRVMGNIDLSFWFAIVLAVIGMIFVYSHLKKRTDSKFILYSWMLVILIFSLPGVMAYLFYNRNTKLISCTYCGNQFLPIKNTCLTCSKEIPMPKTDGREIFSVS